MKNLFENWEIYKNNLNLFVEDSLKNVKIWNFLTEKEIEKLYKNFDYENFKNNFEKKVEVERKLSSTSRRLLETI